MSDKFSDTNFLICHVSKCNTYTYSKKLNGRNKKMESGSSFHLFGGVILLMVNH